MLYFADMSRAAALDRLSSFSFEDFTLRVIRPGISSEDEVAQ
jgi:hypothetical protein